MRSHLAISALGVLAAVGLAPVAAQSRTAFSGLRRRTSSDVCAVINGPLKIQLPGIGLVTIGLVHVCTCVSTVPTILQTNVVAEAAVALAGNAAATTALTDMIIAAAGGTTCQYPDGALPSCGNNNPCGYACSNGFTVSSNTGDCVCESPNAVCGGQCASSCPSAVVVPERRAASAFDRVANRRRMCPRGHTACGIFEQRGRVSEPWECVDVKHDLESCGGCMTPFDASSPWGVDCTAIPGVADVSCMRGSCVVRRCTSGYAVTSDRSRCISTR